MWELKGRIWSETALTLGTALTVSGIVTRISGNDVAVTMPDLGAGSDAMARRAIGEAEIVTAAAGFQERKPFTFSPLSLTFSSSGIPPVDHSDAIQRTREGVYLDLATGPSREIERVDIGPFPAEKILDLCVRNRQLGLAVAYFQRGLAEKDGGKSMAQFSMALEAVQRHGSKTREKLGFTKTEWDDIMRKAQPFRHAPERGVPIIPVPDASEVKDTSDFVRRVLEAFLQLVGGS